MGVDRFMSDSVGKNRPKVQYELCRRKGRTRISLRVTDDGKIVVSAPNRVSGQIIDQFVQSKAEWIDERLDAVRTLPPALDEHTWEEGDRFLFLGKVLSLQISRTAGSSLPAQDSLLVEISPRGGKPAVRTAVLRWYETRALSLYRELVDKWCASLGIDPVPAISIVGYPRRMGSCTHRGALRFAVRSVMLPLPVVDYLALHEVAHLVHFNHGSEFKRLLDSRMPDWRERQQHMNRLRLMTARI